MLLHTYPQRECFHIVTHSRHQAGSRKPFAILWKTSAISATHPDLPLEYAEDTKVRFALNTEIVAHDLVASYIACRLTSWYLMVSLENVSLPNLALGFTWIPGSQFPRLKPTQGTC